MQNPKAIEYIDALVSAEIPQNQTIRELIAKHMMHGPCGKANLKIRCMKDGHCSKKFPKPFRNVTTVNEISYPEYHISTLKSATA